MTNEFMTMAIPTGVWMVKKAELRSTDFNKIHPLKKKKNTTTNQYNK